MWFMTTMKFFSKRPAYGVMHLVNGYDWSALQGKVVVDVSRPLRGDSVKISFSTFGTSHSLYPALPYRPSSFQRNSSLQCGGSTGHLAAAIGMKYPSLTIISQDLPPVIKQAQLAQSTLPPNVSLAAHDFFQPQPVVAAAYPFRLTLHCWSDASCRRILASLSPVMRHGTRLIVMELVMKPAGAEPVLLEQTHRRDAFVMNVPI
jgi:hypothetical protein